MANNVSKLKIFSYADADRKSAEEVQILLQKHNLHPVIKVSK